jgi:nucleotide-binding universal stress UspA family protein
MKTIIIPIDFSEVSLNATRYSAKMFSGNTETKIILYSMYKNEDEKDTINSYLQNLKKELLLKGDREIDCISEMNGDFVDSLERLAFQKSATLIIMGITGKSTFTDFFIGSNTMKMIDKNICPVLIIPPNSEFNGIKNIAMTCDFNGIENDVPVMFIKEILNFFNPTLHILNINSELYISVSAEYKNKCKKMEDMFKEYQTDFYFLGMYDFFDSVEKFVEDKKIDMLITIPKYHSFFEKMFKTSHTKKLAMHSKVPMLAAHA